MKEGKPKILLCWAYHRKHFVNIFNSLGNDFEFVYLNWLSSDLEIGSFTDSKKIYWLDFKNVQQIINEVKPFKVVFMGMEGVAVLLNQHCKNMGIPTYFFQHGIFHPYEAYLEGEMFEKKKLKDNGFTQKNHSVSLKKITNFFLASFSLKLLNAFFTIMQLRILTRVLQSRQKAFYLTKSSSRRATKSIVFTRYCSSVLLKRDGVKAHQILEIGNPEADEILIEMDVESKQEISEEYYLLIDDPLVETTGSKGLFNSAVANTFYNKLNQFALHNGKRLVIKLHPDNYQSTWLLQDENIIYKRASNMANLLKFSAGVFGGNSTLIIPALYTRPCCLFDYNIQSDLHKLVRSINYCKILNYFEFNENDISFDNKLSANQKEKFIEAYLFSTDKQAVSRFKTLLKTGNV